MSDLWPHLGKPDNQTHSNFNIPPMNSLYGKHTISYMGTKIWNSLPINVKQSTNFCRALESI